MRTTQKQLDSMLRQLAAALNRPLEAYTKDAQGHFRANVGALVFDSNNPGDGRTYNVRELVNESAGESSLLGEYRLSPWECYVCLLAAQRAVEQAIGRDEYSKRVQKAFA